MDRPIIFSGPMVRALLDGGKTQTRRLVTRHTVEVLGERWGPNAPWSGLRFNEARVRENSPISGSHMPHLAVPFCHPDDEPEATEDCGIYRITPVVEIGDRLWVREAWRCNGWASDVATIFYRASEGDGYTAMCEQYPVAGKEPLRVTGTWRPSIHMPRWASRLTLTVTDVRVQRLQEISEEDAAVEGAPCHVCGGSFPSEIDCHCFHRHPGRIDFEALWESLNAKRAPWESNPWVVALTFTVHQQNFDTLEQEPAS